MEVKKCCWVRVFYWMISSNINNEHLPFLISLPLPTFVEIPLPTLSSSVSCTPPAPPSTALSFGKNDHSPEIPFGYLLS